MISFTQADIIRFMSFVEKLPSGCWFWTGARSRGKGNKKWYGSFWVQGKAIRAHRFADEILAGRGPLPKGYHRDHKCEFSLCVNPECLERTTHEENDRRKWERTRKRKAEQTEVVITSAWHPQAHSHDLEGLAAITQADRLWDI